MTGQPMQQPAREQGGRALLLRGALLSVPAILIAAGPWSLLPETWQMGSLWLTALLWFLYPGYLLLRLLDPTRRRDRSALAVAAVLGYGLWTLPSIFLIGTQGSLATLILAAAVTTLLLAWSVAWRQRGVPLQWPDAQRLRVRLLRHDWFAELLFLTALTVALTLFVTFGGVERHSDRQTYQAQIRSYVDADTLGTATFLPYRDRNVRLELASWLVQLAAVARIAHADPGLLYSFALPPLMLILSLLAVWGLARTVTGSRRGAALAAALLVLQWVSTIALPATADYSWLQRVQLRPEGAFATLGYWAVTSHIMQDKFILIFLMLPVSQLLLLRYLQWGGLRRLVLLAITLVGLTFVHQLGAAFFGLTFAAVGLIHLLRTRSRRAALRLAAVAVLLAFAMIVPFLQRGALLDAAAPTLAAPETAADFVNTGPSDVGLWVWPAQPAVYAVDLFVLWRQPLLVLALILLPVLVVWRRLRTLGDQFVVAMLLLVLFVSYNPLLAPLLGRIITYRMLFRTTWLMELPAILLLARLLLLAAAALRLHSPAFARPAFARPAFAHRGLWLTPLLLLAPLLLAVPLLASRIASGFTLLREVQAASLTAAEADLLTYLRTQGEPNSIVWADRDLIDEIPPAVGHSYGPYFRYNAIDPQYYAIIRDFYSPALEPRRLAMLAEHLPQYVIAAAGSAVDLQLSELPNAFSPVYRNEAQVLYASLPGALTSEPFATLVAAYEAYAANDQAAVQAALREVQASSPANITAQVLMAHSLLARGSTDEALAVAQRAAAAAPDAAWAQRLISQVERWRGEWAMIRDEAPAAVTAYRNALAADPEETESAVGLVQLLGLAPLQQPLGADREAALARLRLAASPQPDRTTTERSSAFAKLGAAYEQIGDIESAETAYRAAVDSTRPWDAAERGGALAALGRFYVRTGQPAAAQAVYTEGLRRFPAAADLYHAAADLAVSQVGREGAVVLYRAAAAANPTAAWPYLALAQEILQHGLGGAAEDESLAAAEAELRKALALEPSNQQAQQLLADVAQMRWGAAAPPATGVRADDLQQQAQQFGEALEGGQNAQAFVPVDQQLQSGWTLVGYLAGGDLLFGAQPAPLWVFWEAPTADAVGGPAAEGWQRLDGNLWVQSAGEVANLLYDGGFEHSAQVGRVLGFAQRDNRPAPLAQPLRRLRRAGSDTDVAALANSPSHPDTSLISPALPISGRRAYLFGGWLRSVGGNASLGLRWLPDDQPSGGPSAGAALAEDTLLRDVSGGLWQHGIRLLEPPQGAAAVEAMLLNLRTSGTALFDDLLLLPIDRPQDNAHAVPQP